MFKILLYVFGFIAIIIVCSLVIFNIGGRNANSYVGDFKPVMSNLENGTYKGNYSFLIHNLGATVSFNIENGKLGKYQFEKLYGTPGYGAAKSIEAQIDLRRNLDFDAVSGATVTSNFAKAAIKNAIEHGPAN